MDYIIQNTIKPFLENPELLIAPVVILFATHWFAWKRKSDELLFQARVSEYNDFITEYGGYFASVLHEEAEWLHEYTDKLLDKVQKQDNGIDTYENEKKLATSRARTKITGLFARCRLVAGPRLEAKLRHFFELVMEDIEDGYKGNNPDRLFVGWKIEALMRYDLRVISVLELYVWLLNIKLQKLGKKVSNSTTHETGQK